MPLMKPRYAGWDISTAYAGAAADAMEAPKPSTKRPPMNHESVWAGVWMAVPMQTIAQPMKIHQRRPKPSARIPMNGN